jgi:hypothetical protein
MLGTFVWDRIHAPGDGENPHEDWGGLTYSLEAFGAARDDAWVCRPIAKVGSDLFDPLCARVRDIDGVASLEGLMSVPQPNNRVDLFYHDDADRCERLQGGVPGWTWAELAPLVAECDALYVNFIAGWELDLGTVRRLRDTFDGPIFCDIHSLLLGADHSGMRIRRELRDWPEWSACFDLVQGNRDEVRIVTGGIEDPVAGVRSLVESGVAAAFSTLGPDGAAWAAAAGSRWLGAPAAAATDIGDPVSARSSLPAHLSSVVDATGCGDVWGTVCFTSLLGGRPVPAAVERANQFGAATAGRQGTAGLGASLSAPRPVGRAAP